MFKDGMSILQIAEARNMTINTIESHLISFLPGEEIKLEQLLAAEKIKVIEEVLERPGIQGLGQVKQALGDEYTYSQIKAVLAARKKEPIN